MLVWLQVKLASARSLSLDAGAERISGLQARLVLPGRRPVLSGVVQLQRQQQDVQWDHEEQFTEVGGFFLAWPPQEHTACKHNALQALGCIAGLGAGLCSRCRLLQIMPFA